MRCEPVSLAAFLVGLMAFAPGASAETQPNAREGERLARQWCASCHLVARDQTPAPDTAPAFATIAARRGMSDTVLRTIIQMPYPRMPQISLSRDETAHIIAYILTLTPR